MVTPGRVIGIKTAVSSFLSLKMLHCVVKYLLT